MKMFTLSKAKLNVALLKKLLMELLNVLKFMRFKAVSAQECQIENEQ